MQLTIKFPQRCSPAEFRDHLQKAIDTQLTPEPLPPVCPYRICLHLDTQLTAQIVALAARHQLMEKEVVTRLAYAQVLRVIKAEKSETNPLLNGTHTSKRKELQSLLIERCKYGIDQKKIALLEASTGVGKSRVMGEILAHLATERRPNEKVWIIAPTVIVMLHLLKEFRHVINCPSPVMLLGKSQFIEPNRSRTFVEEELIEGQTKLDPELKKEYLDLMKWIDDGGMPVSDIGKELSSHYQDGLRFLAIDAEYIAPSVHLPTLLHFDTEEDFLVSLKTAMADHLSHQYILCTHAMFGCLLRAKKVDSVKTLIVDEAHQLEETIATMFGGDLSLFALRHWLKQSTSTKAMEASEIIGNLILYLQKLYPSDTYLKEDRDFVIGKIRAVHTLIGKIRTKTVELKEWQSLLSRILNLQGSILHVRFSPVRRNPSIIAGPTTVHFVFEKLWESIDSALLLSGTLFLPQGDSMSPAYMRIKMNIPQDRLYAPAPLISPWVMDIPILYHPTEDAASNLCYPSDIPEEDDAAYASLENWSMSIATMLRRIHRDSRGGVLALTPSHRDVRILQSLLLDMGSSLIQSKSTLEGSRLFNQMRADGIKPLWIATGPAWTGLSLDAPDGIPAAEDYHLTTLVLIRLPFNLNRSSTQLIRQERMGFLANASEALLQVRQGLGRLIRKEGLNSRAIYILDGRVWTRRSNATYKMFGALFTRYKQETYTL